MLFIGINCCSFADKLLQALVGLSPYLILSVRQNNFFDSIVYHTNFVTFIVIF